MRLPYSLVWPTRATKHCIESTSFGDRENRSNLARAGVLGVGLHLALTNCGGKLCFNPTSEPNYIQLMNMKTKEEYKCLGWWQRVLSMHVTCQ
jgi:hypothetical protein